MPYTVEAKTERNDLIVKLHKKGQSFNDLARQFSVTPQRIHQIVSRARKQEEEAIIFDETSH